MIDISEAGIHWRGYPVTTLGAELWARLGCGVPAKYAAKVIAMTPQLVEAILAHARDTAKPGETYDWYFAADYRGMQISIELFGGVRDERGHHGGQWSVFLPSER